jgi:hypothetical protein
MGARFILLTTPVMLLALSSSCLPSIASSIDGSDECITKTAEYLAQVEIDDSVDVLVAESRKFFPDFSDMITSNQIGEYAEAMGKIGYQEGCNKIIAHLDRIKSTAASCFKDQGLHRDGESYLAVMAKSQAAKEAAEAHFACVMASKQLVLNFWS